MIKGITYQSTPEFSTGSCEKCIAKNNAELCSRIDDVGRCGYSERIIWMKAKEVTTEDHKDTSLLEPKYTVEEVLTVLEDNGYYNPTDSEADFIKSMLQKKSDSEYKQYIALKAKFKE